MSAVNRQLSKAELRRELLRQRQSMSLTQWRQNSDSLCAHLRASPLFAAATGVILAYFSFRQEPDLSPLLSDSRRCWGFPRCVGDTLIWHKWAATDSHLRQAGAYGILEPHPSTPTVEPEAVDLILVPAVACDERGYRLGYGGGYYDRLLSLPPWHSKPTIGIVFEFAYLPELLIDPWDRPLDAVCTEIGMKVNRLI